MYKLRWSKQAKRDAETCERAGFKAQLDEILDTVEQSPYEPTQQFERLVGNKARFQPQTAPSPD